MSPTSYQTAPPRINVRRILHDNCAGSRVESKAVECDLYELKVAGGVVMLKGSAR